MNQHLRWLSAAAGIILWLLYPFIFLYGGAARNNLRCSTAMSEVSVEGCFTDYIPFVEFLAFPVTILLTYPFARFAFTLFANDDEERSKMWFLAARGPRYWRFPTIQVLAAIGLLWTFINARPYPPVLYGYWAYWIAWAIWLLLGIALSWPPRRILDKRE